MTADDLVRQSEAKQFASLSCYKIQEREQLRSDPNGPGSAAKSGPVSPAEPAKVQSIASSHLSLADSTALPLSGKATHSATTGADAQQGSPGLPAAISAKQTLLDASHTASMAGSKKKLPCLGTAAGPQSAADTPLWHRPQSWVWSEIQHVVLRAIATLHWANTCFDEEQQVPGSTQVSHHFCLEFKMHLLRLLHDLLMGHLSDDGMTFWKVLSAGLRPMLWSLKGLPAKDTCYASSLVVALLQRTRADLITRADFAPSGSFTELQQIWSLFGMLLVVERFHKLD